MKHKPHHPRLELWLAMLLALAISSLATAAAGSIVTNNANHALVINGRSVFPIIFSPGPPTGGRIPSGADALQELREAGGLMIRINQTNNWNAQLIADQQAALDWCSQHGMFCLVNLRELSHFTATDTTTPASLANIVDTFRNHPALGMWKNFDEAWWGGVSEADLQRGYAVIKHEDVNHPVEQTHAPRGTVSDLQPYDAAADIIMLDIYPVGVPPGTDSLGTNKEISMVGDFTAFLGQVANGQNPYYMVEQIAWSGVTPPAHTLVFPTFTQERYMAYQAIINGARGLMYFGGNVAPTLNQQDAPLGWNWTFWNNVLKPVVQQIGDSSLLAAALVASNSTLPITISGTTSPDLEFCVREVPPYVYILASKREGSTVNVTFSGLPATARIGEVLFEAPRTVTAPVGQFTDTFAPFDVHVYRFSQTNQSPVISSQPQSRTNYIGTAASFSVTAIGTGPLTYQWRKNGSNLSNSANISGATSPTLSLAAVSLSDGAGYSVVVTGYGSVTSAPLANLTVLNYLAGQTATITSQPQSLTNYAGTTATFSVGVSGTGPFTFQWRKNGTNLSDGGKVLGSKWSALTLSDVSPTDATGYDVIVKGFNSLTSAPSATLTVIPYPTNQLTLYEPFNYPNVGGPVSSNAPANWAYGGSGANDLSVVSGNLSYPGLTPSIGNSVTNGGAGLGVRRLFGTTFNSGLLYFSALFSINNLGYGVWNGVATPIGALTATDSTSFRLSVLVKSNSPSGYVFGVQKSGTGAVATFDSKEYHAGDTVFLVGKYDFTVSPNPVSLWINPDPATLATEPSQGFISATTGVDGYVIDRFNMRQNTTSSVPAAMQWDELRVGVSWLAVTPLPLPPTIDASPQGLTVIANQSATFSVAASGSPTLAYQWRFKGNNIPGATRSSYTIAAAHNTDSGAYSVTVTNPYGAAVSSDALLSVVLLGAWGDNSWGQTAVPLVGASNLVAVAAGAWHSLALRADGGIIAWGDDFNGQCDVPASLTNAVAIAAGGYHSLAIKANGTVVAWGDSTYGQTTVPANLANVIGISAGAWHSLALRDDGTVAAWGDDSSGQTDVPPGLAQVAAVAAGGNHSLALKTNGTVVAWGDNTDSTGSFAGQSIVPAGLSNVVAIAAGDYHSLAVKNDGTVVLWGDDSQAQCDAPAGLAGVVAAAGGGAHSLALKSDGTLAAWGANWNGQCDLTPGLTNAVGFAAGGEHTLVLVVDGTFVPRLFGPRWNGNRFSALLQTFNTKNYGLDYKTSLTATSWVSLPLVPGNGALRMLTDSSPARQRFYRVRQQ